MVEGPGCKVKGEKLKPRIQGKTVLSVAGNAVDKFTKKKKGNNKADASKTEVSASPFHEMVGKSCSDIKTLGKEFFMFFKGIPNCLRVHFLMAGGYRVNGKNIDGDGGGEAKMASFVLQMEGNMTITFNKCSIEMRPTSHCLAKVDNLKSLDICDDTFSHRRAVEAMQDQEHRQVCDVLLDQEVLPGVGNIIKNEALFDSGINPNSKVSELTTEHISHLVKMTRDFSMIFYKCRRDNKPLNRYLKIYRKGTCGQCIGKITNTRLGDDSQRLTSFCSNCQVNDLAKIRSRNLPKKNSLLGWVNSGPSENSEWACEICTLINNATNLKCSACLSPKPVSMTTESSNTFKFQDICHVKPQTSSSIFTNIEQNSVNQNESETNGPPSKRQRLQNMSLVKEKLSPLKLHPTRNIVKQNALDLSVQCSSVASQTPSASFNITHVRNSLNIDTTQNIVLPSCEKHKKRCLIREVRKDGPNKKRFFFSCPSRQCNFFQWADENFPICEGHGKRCVLRVTLKQGPNNGRKFFACSLEKKKEPCQFFQWADQYKEINIR